MRARGAAIKVTGGAHPERCAFRAGSKPRCRRHPEQDFQASLVQLLDVILTPVTYYFAVPNGGFRTSTEAAILQGQGVKPGVPDLIFISRGQPFGLELKADNGRLSDNQVIAHDRLSGAGMKIGVARTLDEAVAFLKANHIPLRLAA